MLTGGLVFHQGGLFQFDVDVLFYSSFKPVSVHNVDIGVTLVFQMKVDWVVPVCAWILQ